MENEKDLDKMPVMSFDNFKEGDKVMLRSGEVGTYVFNDINRDCETIYYVLFNSGHNVSYNFDGTNRVSYRRCDDIISKA